MKDFRVYQREDLLPGDAIEGPAAVEEPGTTTVIDTADRLSVEEHGCLIIHLHASEAMGGVGGSKHAPPDVE
jgi:N-methylhydantoinase A/oxoprolinase/acetone carboxylase beta subunit